jgi:phenylacetate-coenzyme A ligase PaaK-like adenylate-forming protein
LKRNILYRIYHLRNGLNYGTDLEKALKVMSDTQWLTGEDLKAYQMEKLKSLLAHVSKNVPYYRELMKKSGIRPEGIKCHEDFLRFPVLTKDAIRRNHDGLVSLDAGSRQAVEAATGGSTGEPLRLLRDRNTVIWTEAALLRGRSWAGFSIGSRAVFFKTYGATSWLGNKRGKLVNLYYFTAFGKEEELINSMKRVRELKPFCIESYASNLYRIAVACKRHGLDDFRIPVIFSTGEMLYPHQKEFVEEQFGGKVFDYYGCNEIGSLAYECEYGRRHITDEHVILEVTDEAGNPVTGRAGMITITDLDNYSMPFIRYRNGDAGVIENEPCPCGRGLTVLTNLEGRLQDYLRSADGNAVPAIYFPGRFRGLKGIAQYQIVQNDLENITLRIVKNSFFSPDELKEMTAAMKEVLGEDIAIKVEEMDSIGLTARGKNRPVICRVEGTPF